MVLDPVAQLDPTTVAAVVAIFLATYALLRRTCILPLLDTMEKRRVRIETARARRAEADALLAEARQRAEGILERARAEAGGVAGTARKERLRAREARIAEASAAAEAVLAQGRDEIDVLRRSEQTRLAEDLCACVGQVLSRMIGSADEKKVRFLVNRALAGREPR